MEKINDIVMIEINKIIPNPHQPRQIFEESSLDALAASIKSYGILQPISVRQIGELFEIIMGERRYRASQIVGLKTIPAIILDVGEEDSAVVALIENLQRVDLNFLEEAESYRKLIEEHDIKQIELAEKIGKSQSSISNKLRLLNLSSAVIDVLKTSKLTERHGRYLLKLKDLHLQEKAIKHIIKNELNVKDTETYINKILMDYKKTHQKTAFKVNYRIYLNTIKKSFKVIKEMTDDVTMETDEYEDYIEVKIKIPK